LRVVGHGRRLHGDKAAVGVGDTHEEGEVARFDVIERDGAAVSFLPGLPEASFEVLGVVGEDLAVAREGLAFGDEVDALLSASWRRCQRAVNLPDVGN
jgi:hypothetical protein